MAKHKSTAAIWLEYLPAAGLLFTLRVVPRPLAVRIAALVLNSLTALVPKLKKAGRENLALAFPEKPEAERRALLDGVFTSLARVLVAVAHFPTLTRANVANWISYEGLEHYTAAKSRGKGILVATAHLGNWELSAFAHALLTEPMYVMVRPLDNWKIDALVEDLRTRSGNTVIGKRDGARTVLRALKANHAVGMLIDQNTSLNEGVFVNFFNRPACANSGFVKLAHHSGAPVIPGFALWHAELGRYVLRFYPEIPMSGDATEDTQRIHSFFEEVIRRYPEQWMWIHRRWKTQPLKHSPDVSDEPLADHPAPERR